jgi:hypothetical protein
MYTHKSQAPPTPLHLVITTGPFCKWGIEFMTCNPHLTMGTNTSWYGWLTTSLNGLKPCLHSITWKDTTTYFFFNHVITRFGVPLQLMFDHEKHFENKYLQNCPQN